MSLCPSTVSSGGQLPEDFYFALKSDIAPPQVLSQNANTVSLSGGGGAVNIAATSAVALSTQKLTAVTYDTGLLETNVSGVLNVGLGSAIGSTRVEGGKVVIQRDPGEPQIEFVKGVNVERIKYDGTKLLMGSVGISGEIYDNFGSPGAAGQQLQSSGPGLPFVWGAGSGVGLTAVVAGTNIGVDNTNPIAPIVNVAISSTLDMSGQNIINGNDVTLKGANPSINFQNIAGTARAFLDYADFSDQVTLSAVGGAVNAEAVAFGSRMILDTNGAALTSTDRDVTIQRSQTGLGIRTIATFEDNGVIQIGAPGIGTNPSLDLVPTSGLNATIAVDGTGLQQTTAGNISLTAIMGEINLDASSNINVNTYNGGIYVTSGILQSIVLTDDATGKVVLTASAASGSIDINAPSVLLGGITTYDTAAGAQTTVQAAVDNLDQVLTNNAYVPMTWYKRDIGFTIDPAVSLAFQTPDFVWRYSGGFATGTNSESRYCGTLKYQIDVNISAEDLNDTVVWWVRLFNANTSAPYYSTDFPDERFGFVADRVVNPYSGVRNQCVSFSSTFDLEPGFTGQAVPVDGEIMRIEVYGWGTTSTTTPRAQVSATIRPLRLLQ